MLENPSVLKAWLGFFSTLAESSAALTGLMFVVVTLVTRTDHPETSRDGITSFSTPTVMHFCAALYASVVLIAPWRELAYPSVLIGLGGLYGVVYIARVMSRTKSLSAYFPDVEDWVWYTILPIVAYSVICAAAVALSFAPVQSLFVLAGGALLLVFIGIRNSWDVVTFIAIGGAGAPNDASEDASS